MDQAAWPEPRARAAVIAQACSRAALSSLGRPAQCYLLRGGCQQGPQQLASLVQAVLHVVLGGLVG